MQIRPGQRVRVPAGTPLSTTHPTRKSTTTTKQARTVKVHHVLPAHREILADTYIGDGSRRVHFRGRVRDQENLCRRFGLPCQTPAELQASLETLLSRTTEDSPYPHGKVIHHWLEVEPEKVVWAGREGYWCEVPASAVSPEN